MTPQPDQEGSRDHIYVGPPGFNSNGARETSRYAEAGGYDALYYRIRSHHPPSNSNRASYSFRRAL